MSESSTSNQEEISRIEAGETLLLTLNNCGSWRKILSPATEKLIDSGIMLQYRENISFLENKKILDAIKLSCSAEVLPLIVYAEFAKDALDCLMKVAAWTDLEKVNYRKMQLQKMEETALARVNSFDAPEVDKVLTRRNYRKWKIYMQNLLFSKYLWTVVDGSDKKESRFYKERSHNAMVNIRMSCGEEMFDYIEDEDNASDAWCKLEGELGAATDASMVYCNEIIIENELLWCNANSELRSNYENWVFCMKNYLIVKGLWGFLEEPEISDIVKDEEALDAIKASCTPEMRAYILYMSCTKEAWEKLATVTTSKSIYDVYIHRKHCDMVNQAARNRASDHSEAGKDLTWSNYQKWEEYVTMLLRSRFLYDVVLPIDPESNSAMLTDYETKKVCALRIIKEACGQEMMPYIFRSKSPGEALNCLRKAFSMHQYDDYMKYSRLHHAIQKNGFKEEIKDRNDEIWRGAHKFFRDFPEALTAIITRDGSPALHVAVRLGRVDFVKELLKLMSPVQSILKTRGGNTSLGVAAVGNNKEIVEMLIFSNPRLLLIGNENELNAVTIAAINGNEMIMNHLYPLTDKSPQWWGARNVASCLTSAARLNAFDIVEDLLSHFPDYALVRDDYGRSTLLSVLARKPFAFPSGNRFGFFGGWIYRLAGSKTHGTVLKALKIIVPGVKQVLDSRKKHGHTAVILQQICYLLPNLDHQQLTESFINDAVYQSTIHGIIEVFEILIDSNPHLEHFRDENGRGLFQIAIIHRQERIFQYMSQMGQGNQDMTLEDNFGNNALHCAALWDPSSQPVVHGPALQIQRELQWFQEVERVVPPRFKEMRNKDNFTPKTLFSLQHKDLVKDAEKWMKEMAQACILVTALIATVMFAAPFTLPGGTDQNTGVSLTLQSRAFKVFIVSDVISLFASCTSLLMFFSILTARYAERDFLTSLPRRLILGLFTLFFSIATMMATFTAVIVIVLRGEASRAYIWVSILACIPVLIFALLQFRLFGNLVISTYGRGIFRSKRIVVAPFISIGYG